MVWIDDIQENNIWQIGTPQKEYFEEAYSIPNAILTDTLQYYGENVHSSFVVSVKDQNWFYGSPSVLTFKHKFDTDTLNNTSVFLLKDIPFEPGIFSYQITTENEMKHTGKFVK